MVQPGTRRHQKDGTADKKSKWKDCGKTKEIGDFSSTDPYKIEMMLEKEEEEFWKANCKYAHKSSFIFQLVRY
jgi:hypothetical protein